MRATCSPRGWSITLTLDFRRGVGAGRENRFHVHVNRTELEQVCDPRPRLIDFNRMVWAMNPGLYG
jgi:hypothetical protein